MVKKKILFINNTMGRAGAENALISLFNSLNSNELEIDFLSVINRGEMFSKIPEYVNILNDAPSHESLMTRYGRKYMIKTVLGALFYKFYFIRHLPYLVNNFFTQVKRGCVMFEKLFWHALAMRASVPKKEYDLAIAFIEGAATYCVADRVKAKKKAAFVQIDYIKAGYMKELDKAYYDKIDAIFMISQSMKDNFQKVYPEYADKLKLFQHILIPEELFESSEKESGFTDGFTGIRILTVARLHPQKALDVAIKAFAKLVSTGCENAKWYIIGEGAERSYLEKRIAEFELQDKFILMGERNNPSPYWAQCDIYVQATHFEGWCISLASALIFNKPCIVSNVTGNKEQIVNEKTGIVIDLNEDNLAHALKRLIDDESLRADISKRVAETHIDCAKDVKLLYDLLK